MGRVQGKVAFITGAARGQGRAHAVRLAEEGANVIIMDICGPIASSVADAATPAQLEETTRLVEKAGGRSHSYIADVREYDALKAGMDEGVTEFGGLDIVVANAGMWNYGLLEDFDPTAFREIMEINLFGVWNTLRASVPVLKRQNRGGSIILISSVAGLRAHGNNAAYTASKHGVVGLMRTAAKELGPLGIRANSVHPSCVRTALIENQPTFELFAPDVDNPTWEDIAPRIANGHLIPTSEILAEDIANTVLFLASDESRYTTGLTMTVDAGLLSK